MKKIVLFILILFLSSFIPAEAQTGTLDSPADTMSLMYSVKIITPHSAIIDGHTRPLGNPGNSYFESFDGRSYGMTSFSGREDKSSVSFALNGLRSDTTYVLKFVAFSSREPHMKLGEKQVIIKTPPEAMTTKKKKK